MLADKIGEGATREFKEKVERYVKELLRPNSETNRANDEYYKDALKVLKKE